MKEAQEFLTNNFEKERDPDMPPAEILRPGEQLEEVTEEQLVQGVQEAEKTGIINKLASKLLHKWTLRGLVCLQMAGIGSALRPFVQENIEQKYDFSATDTSTHGAAELKGTAPEIVMYGHRDTRSDVLLNYLSGKEALPPSMREEMTVRDFVSKISEAEEIRYFEDERMVNEFHELITRLQEKYKSFDDNSMSSYLKSKEYQKDIIEYDFYHVATPRLLKSKLSGLSYEEKLSYVHKFYFLVTPNKEQKEKYLQQTDEEFEATGYMRLPSYHHVKKLFSKDTPFDMKQYDAVWTMQQKHGNPELDISNKFSDRMDHGERAYYQPVKNKMYLGYHNDDTESPFHMKDFMAELAHSKQYTEKPETTKMRDFVDSFRLWLELVAGDEKAIKAFKEMEKDIAEEQQLENPRKTHEELYDETLYDADSPIESVEFEAHKKIQPKLEEEYEERTGKKLNEE